MRTNKRRGGFQMTVGLLLIAAALLLTLNNIREQRQADTAAAAVLSQMSIAVPQQEDEPPTLVLTDALGTPLDWPLDAQGEPIPWPVEDGEPIPSVTDGGGRTVYWTQLRGAERPVREDIAELPGQETETAVPTGEEQPVQTLPGGGTDGPAEVQKASEPAPADSLAYAEQDAPQDGTAGEKNWTADGQSTLSDWTVNGQGSLLPWVRDAAGRLTPWPTDSSGQALSWTQLRQKWQGLLDALSPLLTLAASQPAFVRYPEMEMPTREIDGRMYIGMLEVPALELSLPVMSEWSYPRLKKAPCRYVGSIYSRDMVICGHNYDRHFGRLKDLAVGEEVRFTDMDGNVFIYAVSGTEQLGKYAVDEMLAGDWDLTLFTCTKGGQTRVTVRCRLERYIVGENQDEAQQAE